MLSRLRRMSDGLSGGKYGRVGRFAATGALWILGAQVLLCAALPFGLRTLLSTIDTVYMKRFWPILGCLYAALLASIVVNVLLCWLIYTVERRSEGRESAWRENGKSTSAAGLKTDGSAPAAGQKNESGAPAAGQENDGRTPAAGLKNKGGTPAASLPRAGGILLAMSWCTFAESVALVAAAVVMLARVSVMFIFAAVMTALLGLALRVSAKVCRAAGLGRCPAE